MKQLIESKMKEMVDIMQAGLTKDEFLSAFKGVIDYVKKIEQDLNVKVDEKTKSAEARLLQLQQLHQDTIQQIETENQSTFSNVKKWALESVGKLFAKSKLDEKLGAVDAKLSELNAYKLPDTSTIALQASKMASDGLLPLIPIVDKLEEKLPQMGASIRDGLELLNGDERLEIKAIKGLEERLDEVKTNLGGFKSGGVNLGAVNLHTVEGEVPVEVPNSVITAFSLNNTPVTTASLKVYLNGARQLSGASNDYTLSGKTVTFNSAPITGSNIIFDYRI